MVCNIQNTECVGFERLAGLLNGSYFEILAHASRAKKYAFDSDIKAPSVLFALDPELAEDFDPRRNFVVKVFGRSLEATARILDGQRLIGSVFNDISQVRNLKCGDIVVIDAPAKYSDVRYRLRVVKNIKIDDLDGKEKVFFMDDDSDDPQRRPRELRELAGKITIKLD